MSGSDQGVGGEAVIEPEPVEPEPYRRVVVFDQPPSSKVREWTLITIALLLVLSIGAFACLIIVFLDKQSDQDQFLQQSEANAAAITALTADVGELQDQLSEAKALLAASDTEDRLANECVDFASATLAGKTADLVVALATSVPGTPERAALVMQVVNDLGVAKDYVLKVVEQRPQDCPPYPLNPGEEP